MNEGEKALQDKLDMLGKRIENCSPLDTKGLEAINRDLDELVDNDWMALQKQQKRILAMPNLSGTETLGRSVSFCFHLPTFNRRFISVSL